MKPREGIVTPVLFVRRWSLNGEVLLDSIPGLGTHNAMLFSTGTLPSPSLKVMWKASDCFRQ